MTFSLRRHSSLHFLSPLFIDGKCTMVCVGLCLIFISRPSGFGSLLWLADVCHLFTLSERSAGKDEVVIKAGRTGVEEGMREGFVLVHCRCLGLVFQEPAHDCWDEQCQRSPKFNLKGKSSYSIQLCEAKQLEQRLSHIEPYCSRMWDF